MKKTTIKRIKELCGGEVKFVSAEENTVTMLFPYSNAEIELLIEGETEDELVDDFISKVNQHLDDMADHILDCKL